MSDSKLHGFVLVPQFPTPEMIDAGRWSEYYEESSRMREVDDDEVAGVWALMLAAAPKPQQWQPIETAPTDGTWFLACKPKLAAFVALILDTDHPDCEYDGGVHCSWDHKYVEGVTHWMPLPASPSGDSNA